jgi:hypothetical protein
VGLNVNDLPEQTEPPLTAIVGEANTETEATAVFEDTQPKALVPVTE